MSGRQATTAIGNSANAWPSTLPNTLAAIGLNPTAFPGVVRVRDIEKQAEAFNNVVAPDLATAVTNLEPAEVPFPDVFGLTSQVLQSSIAIANGDGGAVPGLRTIIAAKAGAGGWPPLGPLNPATDPLVDLLAYLNTVV